MTGLFLTLICVYKKLFRIYGNNKQVRRNVFFILLAR